MTTGGGGDSKRGGSNNRVAPIVLIRKRSSHMPSATQQLIHTKGKTWSCLVPTGFFMWDKDEGKVNLGSGSIEADRI